MMNELEWQRRVAAQATASGEADGLEEFYRRASAAAEAFGAFEIVLVDDGSKDATWSVTQCLLWYASFVHLMRCCA